MEKTDSTRHIAIIENCTMSAIGLQHLFAQSEPQSISAACSMISMALRRRFITLIFLGFIPFDAREAS